MTKQKNRRKQNGFTLTELAIVLGVMSVIVGAIWSASSSVSESRKESDAITELQTISQGILTLMGGQTFPAAVAGTEITSSMIKAQAIPSSYMDSVSNATADDPWDPGTNLGLKAFSIKPAAGSPANIFRVTFYNVTSSGCINLLLQGTACQAGQPGCPVETWTNHAAAADYCLPNTTGCMTGTASATAIGWGNMTPANAALLCAKNTYTTGGSDSVEFDYSTQ